MDITLTGATGFIGRHLVAFLTARGDRLTILSRNPKPGDNPRYLRWDTRSVPPLESMDTDAVIHLAGEPVAQRWNGAVKERIRASRIEGTRALMAGLAAVRRKPKVLVSASAIGIYGSRQDEVLTESAPRGSGFLADVTAAWEEEARPAESLGIRVVLLRIGIVLGADGGALAKMLPAFRSGGGGRMGTGEQWMSWIHIDDLVGLIGFALGSDRLSGPVNATAPNPVRNAEFTYELAGVLHRPALVAMPALILKLIFGEMATMLTDSQRVSPEAALRAGYAFCFTDLRAALADVLQK
jgi:uncharacterized protein